MTIAKCVRSLLAFVAMLATLAAVIVVCLAGLRAATSRSPVASPHPLEIAKALPGLNDVKYPDRQDITAADALRVTAIRVLATTSLSLVIGLVGGLLLAYLPKRGWPILHPSLDFYRSIPVTFFLPATTLLIGTTHASAPWLLASIPCSLIMVLHIRNGAASVSTERVFAFQVLAGTRSRWTAFVHLRLPLLMPDLVLGLRLSVSYAIVIISVLEYMNVGSAKVGFGTILAAVENSSPNSPAAWAAVISFGLLGVTLNWVLDAAEGWVKDWRDAR
jgi:ABC-type nitrate/sulfonate/bicarbonate transport system permease component